MKIATNEVAARVLTVVLLTVSLSAGCGSSGSAPGLDEAVAKNSLTQVLDAWKQGQTPETLQQASPSIIAVDFQWQAGQRLVRYQLLEPSTNDGSNLHVRVELELEDGAGVRSKQTTQYTVGTSPKITVFSQEPSETL